MTQKNRPVMKAKNGVAARQKLLKTFHVDHTSEIDGVRYYGDFVTKKLSIADLASIGVRKSQLNGGMYFDANNPGMGVNPQTDDFNAMIAHLEVALQSWPQWWDLDTITDTDLLAVVFEEVMSHENSFRGFGRSGEAAESDRGSAGSGEGTSEGDPQESAARRVAGEMVGEEVQSALEP